MNVIVGANNVGKSNLLRAIDFLHALPSGPIPRSWWPEGKGKGVLSAHIELEFHPRDLREVETLLRRNPDYKVQEPFYQFFGTHLQLADSWRGSDVYPECKLTMGTSPDKPTATISIGLGNDVANQLGESFSETQFTSCSGNPLMIPSSTSLSSDNDQASLVQRFSSPQLAPMLPPFYST